MTTPEREAKELSQTEEQRAKLEFFKNEEVYKRYLEESINFEVLKVLEEVKQSNLNLIWPKGVPFLLPEQWARIANAEITKIANQYKRENTP